MAPRPTKAQMAAAATAAEAKPDFLAMLAGARLPEAIVRICLRGDLAAEHEAADRELQKILDAPVQKLNTGAGPLRQQILDLEAEMEAHTYPFRLRALPKPRWRALCAEHPGRIDPETSDYIRGDGAGINSSTFFDPLIRLSVIDPVLVEDQWRELLGDSDEERARLTAEGKAHEIEDGKLTDRQLDELSGAAFGLNRRDIDVPFSRAASRLTQISGDE